ncbi:MAG: hypothetical protein AAFR35_00870 [Pseudomonadota bacterium]
MSAPLSAHRLHGIRPVGAPYVLGRWHKDRASGRGLAMEARLSLKAMLSPGRPMPQRFLILGRPRSGSTLLTRLLDQVDGMRCDGEMLHFSVAAPIRFLDLAARNSGAAVYGSKLLTYQMLEVQKLSDPEAFLRKLLNRGYRLVHLTRNTFDQALSLSVAQARGTYHALKGEGGVERAANTLDPDLFLQQVRWNDATLDYERALLSGLPHDVIDYDQDLARSAVHQATVDRICGWFGLPETPVAADLDRVGGKGKAGPSNLDELTEILDRNGFGHLVPAGET